MECTNPIINDALQEIKKESIKNECMTMDLWKNNESQKAQIKTMRIREEANDKVIDGTILIMLCSMLVNWLTIGWIVYTTL